MSAAATLLPAARIGFGCEVSWGCGMLAAAPVVLPKNVF